MIVGCRLPQSIICCRLHAAAGSKTIDILYIMHRVHINCVFVRSVVKLVAAPAVTLLLHQLLPSAALGGVDHIQTWRVQEVELPIFVA